MSLYNTTTSYGLVSRALHWLTVLVIFAAIPFGLLANRLPYDTDDQIARTFLFFSTHKTLGLAALALGILRLVWSLSQPCPAPLHPARRWETALAVLTHWTLSLGLIVVPLAGWAAHSATPGLAPIWWPFGQSLPLIPEDPNIATGSEAAHRAFAWLLLATLALHIVGAIKHAIVDRDGTISRMTRGTSIGPGGTFPKRKTVLAATLLWAATFGLAVTLTEKPPAPPVPWPTRFLEVSLLTKGDAEIVGRFPASDAALTLSDDGTGTLDIFVALDSLESPDAGTFLTQMLLPILTFAGTVAPTSPGISAVGTLDAGGNMNDLNFTITIDEDTAILAPVFPVPGASDYTIKIEAVFERPVL